MSSELEQARQEAAAAQKKVAELEKQLGSCGAHQEFKAAIHTALRNLGVTKVFANWKEAQVALDEITRSEAAKTQMFDDQLQELARIIKQAIAAATKENKEKEVKGSEVGGGSWNHQATKVWKGDTKQSCHGGCGLMQLAAYLDNVITRNREFRREGRSKLLALT